MYEALSESYVDSYGLPSIALFSIRRGQRIVYPRRRGAGNDSAVTEPVHPQVRKELDVELISRGRAGVRTTEAGDSLYSVTVKLQTLLAEADQRIPDIAHGRAGTISVCSAPEFNWTLMPEVLHRLQKAAPTVMVFLSDPSPGETLARVIDGSVDVGLMPSADPSAFAHRYQDELVVHTAAVFPFMLGLPEHLRHLPDPISLMDLADETWVMPPHNAEFSGLREVLSKM